MCMCVCFALGDLCWIRHSSGAQLKLRQMNDRLYTLYVWAISENQFHWWCICCRGSVVTGVRICVFFDKPPKIYILIDCLVHQPWFSLMWIQFALEWIIDCANHSLQFCALMHVEISCKKFSTFLHGNFLSSVVKTLTGQRYDKIIHTSHTVCHALSGLYQHIIRAINTCVCCCQLYMNLAKYMI